MKFDKKLFTIPQLMITLFFLCCYTFKSTSRVHSVQFRNIAITKANNDSTEVTKSITGFLNWYKTNLNKANSFPLLTKDTEGYFMIHSKACSDYLNFLKSSSFVSPEYILLWQKYFEDKAVMLKKDKIESDIPEGFDFDFILFTQEPELVLDHVSSLKYKILSMEKSLVLVSVSMPSDSTIQYEFEMGKSKSGWQINYISTPNFD